MRRTLAVFLIVTFLLDGTALAESTASQDVRHFTRADLYLRQQEPVRAADELGGMTKRSYDERSVRRTLSKTFEQLYAQKRPLRYPRRHPKGYEVQQKLRITRSQRDADRNSDQSFDNRGLQVSEHLEANLPIQARPWTNTRFVLDLDGFKDGHNDLRYRTLLADLSSDPSHHLAFGDTASYPSPYFLRGSRFRGIHFLWADPENEFQVVAGGYPFWLEDRDAYIYPRTVLGLRDRVHLWEDRFRLGISFQNSRDSEKVRTIDVANQPRDNSVFSFDEEVTLIPNVWYLKAAQAYSYTDDNLLEDRFGDTRKLKDLAFQMESVAIHPWLRSRTRIERTGPDFRILGDVPSGGVLSSKGITADREFLMQMLDFQPWGPIDFDFEASFYRNNLDQDDIEQTRQAWYTANLNFLTPSDWPRLGLRQTLIDTVSIPGSTTRASQTRTYEVEAELSQRFSTADGSLFLKYAIEDPLKDKSSFDEETHLGLGMRLSRPVGERAHLFTRYRYDAFDELYDDIREDGIRHEASLGGSLKLFETAAAVSGEYTFQTGKLNNPRGTSLVHAENHQVTTAFTWPYTWFSFDRRKKLTVLPSATFSRSDFTHELSERPVVASRVSVSYEQIPDWKLEFLTEGRFDDENKREEVGTADYRMWLLYTRRWGGRQAALGAKKVFVRARKPVKRALRRPRQGTAKPFFTLDGKRKRRLKKARF